MQVVYQSSYFTISSRSVREFKSDLSHWTVVESTTVMLSVGRISLWAWSQYSGPFACVGDLHPVIDDVDSREDDQSKWVQNVERPDRRTDHLGELIEIGTC